MSRVGIDIGTSTVAVASDKESLDSTACTKSTPTGKRKKAVAAETRSQSQKQQAADNFNADGTVKKGIKLTWERSNHYDENTVRTERSLSKTKCLC